MSAQSTVPQATPPAQVTKSSPVTRLLRPLAESPEAGVVLACIVVFIVIALNAPTYASVGNLQVMGRDLSQVGILALGESLVILTGGIDLSVGALAGLAGILAAWFNVNQGLPAPAAILFTLVICAGVGFWHGAMVTRLNVPPFGITLVTYTPAQGLSLAITSGTPINGISGLFANVSSAYLWQVPVPGLIFVGATFSPDDRDLLRSLWPDLVERSHPYPQRKIKQLAIITPEGYFGAGGLVGEDNRLITAPLEELGHGLVFLPTRRAADRLYDSVYQSQPSVSFVDGGQVEWRNRHGVHNEEETKMVNETRKIFADPKIMVTATCVRVPVPRAHCESINIEFERPMQRIANPVPSGCRIGLIRHEREV